MISDIDEACAIAGISPRTIQRYHLNDTVKSDGRKAAASLRIPANKITEKERSEILRVANSPQFEPKSCNPYFATKIKLCNTHEGTFFPLLS